MSSLLSTGIIQTSRLLGLSASGGVITKTGSYTCHTFPYVGLEYFEVYRYAGLDIQYLVIGGGGGGSGYNSIYSNPGGGGGAGGTTSGGIHLNRGSYCEVCVGNGGSGGSLNNSGADGELSSIYDLSFNELNVVGQTGSGGLLNGNGGTSGNGLAGGQLNAGDVAAGGGGVSTMGSDGTMLGNQGSGGSGSSWYGYRFGGGGGGGNIRMSQYAAPGGNYGGGIGASDTKGENAINGVVGTGGGGGGAAQYYTSSSGGSGIVIIRYKTP